MDKAVKKNGRMTAMIKAHSIWLILIAMMIVASIASPDFRSLSNISNLFSQSSIVGILAIGQTIVLIAGGFDLSQSSMMAMAAVVIALFLPQGYLLAFLCLAVLEVGNAFFINKGISPFVVTLG
ncbi:MAG: hypothetical protein LUI07_10735, partial [Lachnospiraceae bacterium]|nr:hypothetical protein [Lachnospiraceae bacterium]